VDSPTAELPLTAGARLAVIADGDGWQLERHSDDPSTMDEKTSRRLVEHFVDAVKPLLDNNFQIQQLSGPPTPPPAGERSITEDQTHTSVVVGEQVVVKWLARVDDAENLALRTVAHLSEVGFDSVPTTFGALTWTTPSGRELPVAFVTSFVAGAKDGWTWCVEAVETGERPDFPAELGRLTARLHVALGSPSTLLPLPMLAMGTARIRRWHSEARLRLDELAGRIHELDDAPAGPDDAKPQRRPSEALAEYRPRLEAVIDRLLEVSGRTPIQLIHGDLHVGQVLDSPAGLTVIDFDGNPAGPLADRQPAARDVAQILLSLDQVGRIVDRRSGFTRTAEIDAWSVAARMEFLGAYRAELTEAERRDVLDVRLLPSFLVEQACRDLLYAAHFRPRWAYATIDGLATLLTELPLEGRDPDGSPEKNTLDLS
jgi:maltokinase